jgi:hypothetical protein
MIIGILREYLMLYKGTWDYRSFIIQKLFAKLFEVLKNFSKKKGTNLIPGSGNLLLLLKKISLWLCCNLLISRK